MFIADRDNCGGITAADRTDSDILQSRRCSFFTVSRSFVGLVQRRQGLDDAVQVGLRPDARHTALGGLAVLVDVARQGLVVVGAGVGQPADVVLAQALVVDVCCGERGKRVDARLEAQRLCTRAERPGAGRALRLGQAVRTAIVDAVAPLCIEKQGVACGGRAGAEVRLGAGLILGDGLAEEVEPQQLVMGLGPGQVGVKLLILHQLAGAIAAAADAHQGAVGDFRPVDDALVVGHVDDDFPGLCRGGVLTLGFAFKIVGENEPNDCTELVSANDLNFLGVVAISDPIRPDVPAAVAKCQSAGIGIKIVTGDTPGTATEIARQIGLWQPETDTDRNRITGVAFAELSDEEALDRVMDLKIMSRARPTDKQRLVQLLQQKGAVVAVTGDGTNDAPALNHAQVGLSMGTGTSVAKEASDITLLDDSFNSIGTAVMWGRSLYKNIQRFIVFQLTINFVALLIVLLGSMIGTELPLTVTQMLWVNLIMDTFAALALASIPPSETVMQEKPRRSTDFIISKAMRNNILGVGTIFLAVLLGMIYYFDHSAKGMDVHNLTIFFTFFVMLQFWNLFNARVFGTTDSAFKGLSKSYGMELIVLAILVGQFLIVQFGGAVFRTEPLDWQTWLLIIGVSSTVLWVGELIRLVQRSIHK